MQRITPTHFVEFWMPPNAQQAISDCFLEINRLNDRLNATYLLGCKTIAILKIKFTAVPLEKRMKERIQLQFDEVLIKSFLNR